MVPFPHARSSAGQYLSHPQQILSGFLGFSGTRVLATLKGYRGPATVTLTWRKEATRQPAPAYTWSASSPGSPAHPGSAVTVTRSMIWILAVGLALKFLSHTAPFPFLLEAFAPREALWQMPATDPPTVYLTFDDGPNPAATPAVLDALARTGARATFFVIARHLSDETTPIVRRAFAEGHAVAIHADTRALLLKTPAELEAFLEATAFRIEQLGGRAPCRLFRPHAGWRGGAMYAGVARAGYRLVGWGWGLWDWNWYRARDGAAIAARLSRRASAGDIIVLHDGHHVNPRADRRYAVEVVQQLVPALKKRGFRFGTLCE